jgi:hypothetical protein
MELYMMEMILRFEMSLGEMNLGLAIGDRTSYPVMNAVENYAKRWTESKNEELDTLSEIFIHIGNGRLGNFFLKSV